MTPETCSTEYDAVWNATHVPDPIDTSVIDLQESVAQLQADMACFAALEGSRIANGSSGSSGDDEEEATATSSSSPFIVMKSIMTVATIIGLVAIDCF